jgi:hypothetical protein
MNAIHRPRPPFPLLLNAFVDPRLAGTALAPYYGRGGKLGGLLLALASRTR